MGKGSKRHAQGPGGYADDRFAAGAGWTSFDIAAINCPVTVLHGTHDPLTPIAHAHHTAAIVPGATLRVLHDLGHVSITPEVVCAVWELLVSAAMWARLDEVDWRVRVTISS